MKLILSAACSFVLAASFAYAQQSPSREATGSIGGKTLTIKYDAPSVRGRKIFGDDGRLSKDPNYPVWRAGANGATAFHTDADLQIGDLMVPKGDYTLFVLVADPNAWQLIINKQTGEWGLSYDPSQDLGRVKMNMSKPSSKVEELKYTITSDGPKKAKIELAWDEHAGSVTATLK